MRSNLTGRIHFRYDPSVQYLYISHPYNSDALNYYKSCTNARPWWIPDQKEWRLYLPTSAINEFVENHPVEVIKETLREYMQSYLDPTPRSSSSSVTDSVEQNVEEFLSAMRQNASEVQSIRTNANGETVAITTSVSRPVRRRTPQTNVSNSQTSSVEVLTDVVVPRWNPSAPHYPINSLLESKKSYAHLFGAQIVRNRSATHIWVGTWLEVNGESFLYVFTDYVQIPIIDQILEALPESERFWYNLLQMWAIRCTPEIIDVLIERINQYMIDHPRNDENDDVYNMLQNMNQSLFQHLVVLGKEAAQFWLEEDLAKAKVGKKISEQRKIFL